MSATVIVNLRTVVHKDSAGIATAFPDPCKTPTPGGPVPIPYPNIAQSSDTSDGSKKVKCDKNPIMLQGSNFRQSTGDEAGSAGGGVVSNKIKGKAEFVNYSFDVKVEGKPVPRLGDMMLQNCGSPPNTPPMPEVQPPAVVVGVDDDTEALDFIKCTFKFADDDETIASDISYVLRFSNGYAYPGKTDDSGVVDLKEIPKGKVKIEVNDWIIKEIK
ncbi:MAG: DUF4150 domain-containing protein [Desulfobacteraceae bacterium]|jgi:hypothetical protein